MRHLACRELLPGSHFFASLVARGAGRMPTMAAASTLDEALRQCRDMDASVNARLACYADAVRRLTPPFAAAVDRLIDRLQEADAGAAAPRAGAAMPPFLLPDDTGHLVSREKLVAT